MCVCACVQESSHCFWPQGSEVTEGEGEEVYGKLSVTLKRLGCHGDIMERRLEVVEVGGQETRVVTLLQLTSWPPEEVPHPSAILSLVDLLSKAQRSSPSKHTVIMCR